MTERAAKRAFVLQRIGSEGSACRARADRVFEELIKPVCGKACYDPVRADQLPAESVAEPIISPIATSPLVIADLAAPPWDENLMMEVGFRLANGRPIVFLIDETVDDDELPLHLQDRDDSEFLSINPDRPTDRDRRRLGNKIRSRERKTRGWQSHYPMVEFSVPLQGEAPAKFVSVNRAAANLYGVNDPRELLDMSVTSADEMLKKYMPEVQRDEFADDQTRLFGQVLNPRNRAPALAKIPAWVPSHPIKSQQSRIYWPILLQHKFSSPDDNEQSVVMRVAFVPVEGWDARGPKFREFARAIRLPDLFRRKFKYDVFLSYNSRDRETVTVLAAAFRRFNLRVWFDEDNLTDRNGLTSEIKTAMRESRIIAAVLGRHGLGPWQNRVELRNALKDVVCGKVPFALLLTNDISVEDDEWLQYVPTPFKDTFQDRLYLQLPALEELNEFVVSPPGENLSLVQRMVKLLADAIHAEVG